MKRQYRYLPLALSVLCLFLSRGVMAQTGAVLGFGDNTNGQIGDNTTTQRHLATPAFQISGIKAISSGYGHTLALDSSGVVWAWGANANGQLGAGDTAPHNQPVAVLAGIKAISAGGFHSMALDYKGQVWAWGDNFYGELGIGTFAEVHFPVLMADSANNRVKAISAGGHHSLVLTEHGDMYGCGNNAQGELAQPDFSLRTTLTFMRGNIKAISAGGFHTLAQTTDNRAIAVGYDFEGQLGDGVLAIDQNQFVTCMGGVRSISAGLTHSMAVSQDGRVFVWGDNSNGQLGMGDNTNRIFPVAVPNSNNVKAVSAGNFHSLVLTAGGTVLATGANNDGQLGDGTTVPSNILVAVKNVSFVDSISAGGAHSEVLRPVTKVRAAGEDIFGELGLGNQTEQDKPVTVSSLSHIVAIATGNNSNSRHSLFLRADGTVWATGYNQFGQLGNGNHTNSLSPVQVKGPGGTGVLSNIIAIAAGDNHSMALAANGLVYTWGRNDQGQLGVGSGITSFSVPISVPFASNVFAIAAGDQHSLLLSDDGSLYSAGFNSSGQLGQPFFQNHIFFDRVEGIFFQIAIAAGTAHSLMLNGQGQILAWGNNFSGQLGNGNNTNLSYPTLQPGTQAIAIYGGDANSACVNGAGQAFFTGFGAWGQFGLGIIPPINFWTTNSALAGMTALSVGSNHALAISAFGNLTSCGDNERGQLGIGTTVNQTSFTFVRNDVTSVSSGAFYTMLLTYPRILVASVSVSPSTVKGGTSVTGKVTLSATAGPGGQRVFLFYAGSSATGPAFVDVAPTSNTATFTIHTNKVTANSVTTVAAYLNQTVGVNLTVTP